MTGRDDSDQPVGASEAALPADFLVALAAAPAAMQAWDDLTQIGRRDFLSWIESAKQAETRRRRIRIACENLVKGKRRPCCYAVVPMDLYKALGADPVAKVQWGGLSANEKRDFSDWVESSADKNERRSRVQVACRFLAEGARAPRDL